MVYITNNDMFAYNGNGARQSLLADGREVLV